MGDVVKTEKGEQAMGVKPKLLARYEGLTVLVEDQRPKRNGRRRIHLYVKQPNGARYQLESEWFHKHGGHVQFVEKEEEKG